MRILVTADKILEALRELYMENPGQVETDLGGSDQYSSGEVRRVIEQCLREEAKR